MSSDNIWTCWQCGKCCRLFVNSGARITPWEYEVLKEEFQKSRLDETEIRYINRELTLPVLGESPPKRCIFLKYEHICSIYDKRPRICQEYPIITTESSEDVIFHVSTDCPRGEKIAQALVMDMPIWAKKFVGNRGFKVITSSFFDLTMSSFLGEEL